MTFFQAIECMKDNIPVRHKDMKKGEFITIKNEQFVRVHIASAYCHPYQPSLSDYDADWERISEEHIDEATAEQGINEDRSFFEAVCMMYQGFVFAMKDDDPNIIYFIEDHGLIKVDAGGTENACKINPTQKHYGSRWYAVGMFGKV